MSQLAEASDDTIRLRILDAIKELTGPFTVSEIVARTGVPPWQAESTLNILVREYDSDLDVDEDGNLIYQFSAGLSARPDIVDADRRRRRKEKLKRFFMAAFKVWTVAMVVVYFILYVVLIVAAMVAASQNREGGSSSSRSSHRGGGGWMFFWMTRGRGGYYGGYGSHRSRRRIQKDNSEIEARLAKGEDPYSLNIKLSELPKPGVAERTWYFLFGSRGIERNPLEREKELLTYIRAKQGVISNADIIALLGVTYDEADAIGTRLVATYAGEMDITDDGVAVYRFEDMTLSVKSEISEQKAELGYLWQVRRKEHHLRNSPILWVPILNGVNIVLALIVYTEVMPQFGWTSLGAQIGLFYFPLLFSVIFYALALSRKLREARDKDKYERDSLRIAIFRLLFSRRMAVKIPGDERAIAEAGLGKFSNRRILELAPEIAKEIRGEVVGEGEKVALRADRLWQEMATVDKLRARLRRGGAAKSIGRTVFSTKRDIGSSAGADAADTGSADADLAAEIAALEQELTIS